MKVQVAHLESRNILVEMFLQEIRAVILNKDFFSYL